MKIYLYIQLESQSYKQNVSMVKIYYGGGRGQ